MPRSTDLQNRSPLLDTTPAVAWRALAGDAAPAPAQRPALREHVGPVVAEELHRARRARRLATLAACRKLADPSDPPAAR